MSNFKENLNDCFFGNILICKLPKNLISDEDTAEDIQIKKIIVSKINPLSSTQFTKTNVMVNHIFNHIKYGSITSKSEFYIKKYDIIIPTSFSNNLKYRSVL